MPENVLILGGGTGAHVGVAYLRLQILGYALGYFRRGQRNFDFPSLFLVDQDSSDGTSDQPTAWQVARSLLEAHPARFDWTQASNQTSRPESFEVSPLPVGANKTWFHLPNHVLQNRFEGSPLLEVFASEEQRRIDYSKGMMGSPSLGSLLFSLKQYDTGAEGLNHDENYKELHETRGRIVIAGSGVGGTGASVVPTLARRLAKISGNAVMAVMLLNWFEFEEDGVDDIIQKKAARRNRRMRENANSALDFYGQTLSREVAAVPVGMPETALTRRRYTGDMGQPLHESYLHAVGALCAFRQFHADQPYGPGLYFKGAVEAGRLDPRTAIPGGTLQDLANRAATLHLTLKAIANVLEANQDGHRVKPAIYEVVNAAAQTSLVAEELQTIHEHYKEQLQWMNETLRISGNATGELGVEEAMRQRLVRRPPELRGSLDAAHVASRLFHWTADWVQKVASAENHLVINSSAAKAAHWPDTRSAEAVGISAQSKGDLDRLRGADLDVILDAYVQRRFLSCNSTPDPLAPVEFFHHMIRRQDKVARRQLELMLLGLFIEELELVPIEVAATVKDLSLERIIADSRHDRFQSLGEYRLISQRHDGRTIGFSSPLTLLCPVPEMDEESGDEIWNELWQRYTGLNDGQDWKIAESPSDWGDFSLQVRQLRAWIGQLKQARSGQSPPWTQIFGSQSHDQVLPYGLGSTLMVFWGEGLIGSESLTPIHLPTQDMVSWRPGPDTEFLKEEDIDLPGLKQVADADDVVFEEVPLLLPGEVKPVRGFWREHLDRLRSDGEIFAYGINDEGSVMLGMMEEGLVKAVVLQNSKLLSRETVCIDQCVVLEQDPIEAANVSAGPKYPDLPIRGEFLDLVQTKDGENLLSVLSTGKKIRELSWLSSSRRDGQGGTILEWTIQVKGRREPLIVRIAAGANFHGPSHLMVWPRFRSQDPKVWKTYYVFEHFARNEKLTVDTLWSSGLDRFERLRRERRTQQDREILAYPVSYSIADRCHSGGPPLALSVRLENKDELGLFLVPLDLLPTTEIGIKMAVDFGTSHTVAAVEVSGKGRAQIEFWPELMKRSDSSRSLTCHISEHASYINDPNGPAHHGKWLPTYSGRDNHKYLLSELLTYATLDEVQSDSIEEWLPMTHFTVPAYGVGRENIADFLLTDFKWEAGASFFHGREAVLRESFIAMALELALAEVVTQHAKAVPSRQVELTFTYPLRLHPTEVDSFQESLRRIIKRTGRSTGIPLVLHQGVGIYDESRAASVTARIFGQVSLVADLGGGTLDLLLATERSTREVPVPDVVDSIHLGGNILLQRIANNPSGLLPADGGWDLNNQGALFTQLQSWMRTHGADKLFGLQAGGRRELENYGVKGWSDDSQNLESRILVNRYF
ncbi:MAG: hypothetical protein AAF772_06100, partial [Acidobacteriota bacterium]